MITKEEFEQQYDLYRGLIEDKLQTLIEQKQPRSFYEPIQYILESGGKRIRPVLVMMACEAVGGNPMDAIPGGLAVEIVHNFTLVHDDIMDKADKRRGRETVHKRWNESTAILAGDGMMALAYQVLVQNAPVQIVQNVIQVMTTGILEVCEGQAFDLDFQTCNDVTLPDYMQMIEKKTSQMLVFATQLGGLWGNALPEELYALEQFAIAVGQAFQILDDILDTTASTAEFGKAIGGDIIEGKKTYLILRAMEKRTSMSLAEQQLLQKFYERGGLSSDEVPAMQRLLEQNGIITDARKVVETLTQNAHQHLAVLSNQRGKELLQYFSTMLLTRNF